MRCDHEHIPECVVHARGARAHDSFADFASPTPETAHLVMWVMSDREIPSHTRWAGK